MLEKTQAKLEFLMRSIFVAFFFINSEKLVSYGAVIESGTLRVVTPSGSSLTSDKVLSASKQMDARYAVQRERRCVAQAQREQRETEREIILLRAEEKCSNAKKRADGKEDVELQQLRSRRELRRQQLRESRELWPKQVKPLSIKPLPSDE